MIIAVVGGGAAGFFFAINVAKKAQGNRVVIFEKTNKVLSKVKVSGGGRCNVTNATFLPHKLVENYPRGKAFLKKVFEQFSAKDTVEWFAKEHISLKEEPDRRIFPLSNSSQTIVDCFLGLAQKYGVDILYNTPLVSISKTGEYFFINEQQKFDFVFVATGGSVKIDSYEWLAQLGHTVIPPVPSLFTFNIPSNPFKGLEGVSLQEVSIRIEKSKLEAKGAWLVTHWGISGPAVLKLSAWGANELASRNYDFVVYVNFVCLNEEQVRAQLSQFALSNKQKAVAAHRLFEVPSRLWERLVFLAEIHPTLRWCDISKQKLNKLVENLCNFKLEVKGKTTFKEEFVTCGGISLEEVEAKNMESKLVSGLFFGGEVLDIDGITGGFNFQSAWSTAWIAANEVAKRAVQQV